MNKDEFQKHQLSVEAFFTKSALERESPQLWALQNMHPGKSGESISETSRKRRTVTLPLQHHKLHQLPILERFKKLQRIFHPALCQYISIHQDEQGRFLCVKEYFAQTLYTELKAKSAAFSKEEYCSRILFRLLQGLQCCSLYGIGIRNLSLQTVGIDNKHDYKIDDYGLYYMTEYGEHVTFLIGDLAYFSPELILSGKKTGKCSPATDLWSVGIILLSLLAEKPFCEGATKAETVRTILKLGGFLSDEGEPNPQGRDARANAGQAFLLKYITSDSTLNKNYQKLSESFKKIFLVLLRSDPQERSDANSLLSLPYFKIFHQNMDKERHTFQHITEQPCNSLEFLPKIDFFSSLERVNAKFEEKSENEPSVLDVVKSTLPDSSEQPDDQNTQQLIDELIKKDAQEKKLSALKKSVDDDSTQITEKVTVNDVHLELPIDELFLTDTTSKYDKLCSSFGIPAVPKDSLIDFIQCFKKQSKEIDIKTDLVTDKAPLPIFSIPTSIPIEGTLIEDRDQNIKHKHQVQDVSRLMLTANPFSVRTPPPSASPAVESSEHNQEIAPANTDTPDQSAQECPLTERSTVSSAATCTQSEKSISGSSSVDTNASNSKKHSTNPFESDDEQCEESNCIDTESIDTIKKEESQQKQEQKQEQEQEQEQTLIAEGSLPPQLPSVDAGSAEFEQRKVENKQRREQYLNTKFLDEISTDFIRNDDDPRFWSSSHGKVGRVVFAYDRLALNKSIEKKKETVPQKEYETLMYRPKQTFRISSTYYELLGKEKVLWPALAEKEKNLLIDYQRYRADLFNELLRCYKANPFSFNDVKEEIIRQMKRQLPQTERSWVWSFCLDVPIEETKCEEEYAACNSKETLSREIINLIENDVNRSFAFHPRLGTVSQRDTTKRILRVWSLSNAANDLVYWQGIDSVLAPFVLMGMSESRAYLCLSSFVHVFLSDLYRNNTLLLEYLLSFKSLLCFHDPEICMHLCKNGVEFSSFAVSWFMTGFARTVPLEEIFPIWDKFLASSPSLRLFFGITIVMYFRKLLLSFGFDELNTFLSRWGATPPAFPVSMCAKIAEEFQEKTPISLSKIVDPQQAKQTPAKGLIPYEIRSKILSPLLSFEDFVAIGDVSIILDTREKAEFEHLHCKGSINIPITSPPKKLKELVLDLLQAFAKKYSNKIKESHEHTQHQTKNTDVTNNIQISGDFVSIGTGKHLLNATMLSGIPEEKAEQPKIIREDFMPQVDFSVLLTERTRLKGIIPPKAIFICIGDSLENATKLGNILVNDFTLRHVCVSENTFQDLIEKGADVIKTEGK